MKDYKEYKDNNGESIFTLLNANDADLLEVQKQIVSNGYTIIEIGRLLTSSEVIPVIKARKLQEAWIKPIHDMNDNVKHFNCSAEADNMRAAPTTSVAIDSAKAAKLNEWTD